MQRVSPLRAALIASLAALALAATPLSPAQGSAAAARVEIRDFSFHPGRISVDRGTRIVFANEDSIAHTATQREGFATGRIRPGRSASVTLRRAGVYAYHCSIHNFMRGKIVVR